MQESPIPVIIDTDVGDDIDDVWALVMALRCPQLDIRLITTNTGNTRYRAALVAKLLAVAGRSDIPVAIGPTTHPVERARVQERWLDGFDLNRYPGIVHNDAAAAIVDVIARSDQPVTLVAIGPLTTVIAALDREPSIAQRTRFVGMFGCIRRSKFGSDRVYAEYNVAADKPACRKVFAAPWRDFTLTPLDTCGQIMLDGERYQKVRSRARHDPLIVALMDNYKLWLDAYPAKGNLQSYSSCLFDTVAIYLAYDQSLVDMQMLPLIVAEDGLTVVDEAGPRLRCAMDWRDLSAFADLLTATLVD